MLIRLLFTAALAAATSASAAPFEAQADAPPAPVARVAPVTDTHFGERVVDRYRWMESARDRDWLPFLKGQAAHARAVLDGLPQRAALLERIRALSGDLAAPGEVQLAGQRMFYEQRPAGANNFKLYVREDGRERVLVDPTAQDTAKVHHALDWWHASPDGSRIVYGLSKNGSEDSVLHVMDVKSGALLKERIANTGNASPSWLPDSSGFFYNQLTGKLDTPQRYLDSRARFHKLGTDPARDPVVMARGRDKAVAYDRIQMPIVMVTPDSPHALLLLVDVREEQRVFTAPLADLVKGKAKWTPVADFADEVTDVELDGDAMYLLSLRGHPRGRVLKTSAAKPSLREAAEVVGESQLVLQGLARAQDGLYIRAQDGGSSRLLRLGADGKAAPVALPFDGTILDLAVHPERPGATLVLTGWLQPSAIYALDAQGRLADTGIIPKAPIDVSAYTTERRYAKAADGTAIPYSLVYRKDIKRQGANPAYVQAYGSYGAVAYSPGFGARSLALMDQGAVVAYAHVRGGGEYGREWHRAGQLANKPNTWRDLIAVCEDMVANGYTAPARLAIGGRSAGGITVGRAMTERPDLFAAVVSGVGWHNPLRYVAEQNGFGEVPEWGDITDPAGYRALRAIDSYQQVVDGAKYPAVLLTTGVTDPRVAPFHPAKMAARLQAASTSGKPVLLRVDFDAGHGMGSTRAQADAEAADTFAFILAHTRAQDGHPAH